MPKVSYTNSGLLAHCAKPGHYRRGGSHFAEGRRRRKWDKFDKRQLIVICSTCPCNKGVSVLQSLQGYTFLARARRAWSDTCRDCHVLHGGTFWRVDPTVPSSPQAYVRDSAQGVVRILQYVKFFRGIFDPSALRYVPITRSNGPSIQPMTRQAPSPALRCTTVVVGDRRVRFH